MQTLEGKSASANTIKNNLNSFKVISRLYIDKGIEVIRHE